MSICVRIFLYLLKKVFSSCKTLRNCRFALLIKYRRRLLKTDTAIAIKKRKVEKQKKIKVKLSLNFDRYYQFGDTIYLLIQSTKAHRFF